MKNYILGKINKLKAKFHHQEKISLMNLDKKTRLLISVSSVVFALALITVVTQKPVWAPVSLNNSSPIKATVAGTSATLESQFKHVERYPVSGAQKTVIFIPQIHKEPTAAVSDTVNDQAVVIQKEIYSMLNQLVNKDNAKYVMDETNLYGQMPQDKIEKIKDGIALEDKYKSDLNNLLQNFIKNGGSQADVDKIQQASTVELSKFERNIYLTGSAAMLAATNSNSVVYGSQNAPTIIEAKKELENLVYMENRIKELGGSVGDDGNSSNAQPASTNSSSTSQNAELQQILALLNKTSGSNSNVLAPVDQLAKTTNNNDLSEEANKCRSELNNLLSKTDFESSLENTNTGNSINNNPYQTVSNLKTLQSDYNTAYTKFIKLVKDQRSQEVSDNMVKMLNENNQSTGILVLGADHKDQLIAALNKQNINVIVITPDSEINYSS